MAQKKNTHRIQKRKGETYADALARKKAIKDGLEKAATDTALQVQVETQVQRSMWLMVCSIADAFNFGPKNMEKFFKALQENSEELEKMTTEVDADYAYEKLRRKAEEVSGMEIKYLYEHEQREALRAWEEAKKKQGVA